MKRIVVLVSLLLAAGKGFSTARTISATIADYEARSDAMERRRFDTPDGWPDSISTRHAAQSTPTLVLVAGPR